MQSLRWIGLTIVLSVSLITATAITSYNANHRLKWIRPTAPSLHGIASRTTSLQMAAARIREYAREEYPDAYGNILVDYSSPMVTVFRLPKSGLDRDLRAKFPNTPLVFHGARFTERYLQQALRRIQADQFWRRRFAVQSIAPAPDASGIQVTVSEFDAARARSGFVRRYGESLIEVVAVPVVFQVD